MNKPKKPTTIIDAIKHKQLLGSLDAFKSLDSWQSWLVWLKAVFALPMTDSELQTFRQCTGRQHPPTKEPREVFSICGRRGGKSFISSLTAVYTACFTSYERYLNAGETAVVLILARDRDQSRVIFNYIHGILTSVAPLAAMIINEKADEIEPNNRVTIMVKTSDYRAVRGVTVALAILDEFSFWALDSVTPDREILVALRPSMATIPNSRLLAISTPYSQSGAMYEQHKEFYGVDNDDVLVWQADSLTMNPTLDQALIQRELERDPEGAQAEWNATFRTDVSAAFSPEALESCTIKDRDYLPPSPIIQYQAFVDPSGGKNDSFTLAIGHKSDDGKAIIDSARAWDAPFNPKEVTSEISKVLKAYGCLTVTGDRFAAEWPIAEFYEHGITYRQCEVNKSELYLALVPTTNAHSIELPDDKRLLTQLRRLERKHGRAGKDTVDHPPRLHDDLANSVAGVSYLLSQKVGKSQSEFNPSLHVARTKLQLVSGAWPLFVGVSYGDGFVSSVIAQTYNDELRVFASFCTEEVSLKRHLEQFTKSWLIANVHQLQLFGGYEKEVDEQLKHEISLTCNEVLQGQWASITKLWESRSDAMRDALTKAVPFKFTPAVQFDPTGTVPLSQALSSGRYREKVQADRKNYHVVNALALLLARRELWKLTPKPREHRAPSSWMTF
jgi:hypothetical protein